MPDNALLPTLRIAPLLLLALLVVGAPGGDGALAGSRASGAGGPPRFVDVVVTYDRHPDHSDRARVDGLGGEIKRRYGHLPMLALRVPETALYGLARGRGVRSIVPDRPVSALSASAKQTARLPAPGSPRHVPVAPDVGIAFLDSGIERHGDLNVQRRIDIALPATGCPGSYRDTLRSTTYSGDDGSRPWSTGWIEIGDDGSPLRGDVQVATAPHKLDSYVLRIGGRRHGTGISRRLDLAGATHATLEFEWQYHGRFKKGEAVLEVRPAAGLWQTVLTFPGGAGAVVRHEVVDLTPYASAGTELRFLVRSRGRGEYISLDNVQIKHAGPTVSRLFLDGTEDGSAVPVGTLAGLAPRGEIPLDPDPQRDEAPGLLLERGGTGLDESDPSRYQLWLGAADGAELAGPATLTLHSALEDPDSTRAASVTAILVDSDASGRDLRELARATVSRTPWGASGGGFIEDRFELGVVRHRLLQGRHLGVKLLVDAASGDDLRVAYGGRSHPSRLEVAIETPVGSCDPFGHGTHVAGFLGGNGQIASGKYTGVAPGATSTAVRVLDGEGRGTTSDVLAGLDWVLDNAAADGIRVVNLSLGTAVVTRAAEDPLVQAVETLWDAGLVVVCAAGNFGRDGHFTITSPGISRKVITVGSITDRGTGRDVGDDHVSTYSSRGPTGFDHFLKPDLIAPGNRIIAPTSRHGKLRKNLPERVPACGPGCTGEYLELSGTSMAASMVSGTVALMLSAEPGLDPDSVKARLMRSARKIDADATTSGAGVLDIDAVLAERGYTAAAPSPRMGRSEEGVVILVEDTAQLWGDAQWSAERLWADGYLWADGFLTSDGYLWADAYLWADSYLWSDGYLWGDGFLWADGYLWADGFLWADVVSSHDPLLGDDSGGGTLADDP